MIQGKNNDVDFRGRMIHVQTEFMPTTKTIVTLIFDNGAIIGSKKKKLVFNGDVDAYKSLIDERVKAQHQEFIKTIQEKAKLAEEHEKRAKEEVGEEALGDYLKDVFGVDDEN